MRLWCACSSALSLPFDLMPPRTTQKSCRPRVSYRIMVGTLANTPACVASGAEGRRPPSRHETIDGELSTGLLCLPTARRPLHHSTGAGCKLLHTSPHGGQRENFFLEILFYRIPSALTNPFQARCGRFEEADRRASTAMTPSVADPTYELKTGRRPATAHASPAPSCPASYRYW
jgi:hypothetical protein